MFRLILATGQILEDRKPIGKIRRLDGGKYVATARGETAEAFSAEFAAEVCCRKIDKMVPFVTERQDGGKRRDRGGGKEIDPPPYSKRRRGAAAG